MINLNEPVMLLQHIRENLVLTSKSLTADVQSLDCKSLDLRNRQTPMSEDEEWSLYCELFAQRRMCAKQIDAIDSALSYLEPYSSNPTEERET